MKRAIFLLLCLPVLAFAQNVPPFAPISITNAPSPATGGPATFSTITDTSLTTPQIVYAGAGGLLSSSGAATDANGDILIPSTATNGLQIFNTADQVTNVEVMKQLWSGNIAMLVTNNIGGGSPRILQLGTMVNSALNNAITIRTQGSTNGQFNFSGVTNNTAGAIGIIGNFSAQTATSGSNFGFQLNTNYNQASGNASNTDLGVNRQTNVVGSGTQRLFDLQVAAATRFNVDTSGNATATGFIKSVSSSGGIGYGTGSGGTVTQLTSRSTGVTINTVGGVVTGNNTSLATTTGISFTVTDSSVVATDVPMLAITGAPVLTDFRVTSVAAGSFQITEYNRSTVSADTSVPTITFALFRVTSN